MSTNTRAPSRPASIPTPKITESTRIGTVSRQAMATSATMWPTRMADRHEFGGLRFAGPRLIGLDVVAGELEEDVVERGRAQGEVAHGCHRVEGDGNGADGRGAVGGGDDQLLAARFDAVDAAHPLDA